METREQLLKDKQTTESIINHCKAFEGVDLSWMDDDMQEAFKALCNQANDLNKKINYELNE